MQWGTLHLKRKERERQEQQEMRTCVGVEAGCTGLPHQGRSPSPTRVPSTSLDQMEQKVKEASLQGRSPQDFVQTIQGRQKEKTGEQTKGKL